MGILVGLGLALVLLYFWLSGHWFARVVMLPVCALPLALGLAALLAEAGSGGGAIGVVTGIALAWPVSSLPIYWRRHQIRRAMYHLNPNRLVGQPTSIYPIKVPAGVAGSD